MVENSLAAFEREMLASERLRVTLLAAVFTLPMLGALVIAVLAPDAVTRYMGLSPVSVAAGGAAMFGSIVAYQLIMRSILGKYIAAQQNPPGFFRYFNVILDALIPTLLLYIVLRFEHPVYGLFTPPSVIYFIFISLSVLHLVPKLCVLSGLVAAAGYAAMTHFTLSRIDEASIHPVLFSPIQHYAKASILLGAGVVSGFVAAQIKQRIIHSFKLIAERNRITSMFGQHVSPAILERLLKQKTEAHGEIRSACVMFLDIRDFTKFSERKPPGQVVAYLNSIFQFMIEIVNRNDGIINKFLGDGFMAFFGAPLSNENASLSAVKAALEIIERLDEEVRAGRIPPTRVGIGLHLGEVLTGSIGSAQRQEYTVIGDAVNLASRIEQLNKEFEAQVLISQTVWQAVKTEPGVAGTPLGTVPIKGREVPVEIYKLA